MKREEKYAYATAHDRYDDYNAIEHAHRSQNAKRNSFKRERRRESAKCSERALYKANYFNWV